MTTLIWTRVIFVPEREMYAVEVYRDGILLRTEYFHSEELAEVYAAEARAGG